MVYDRAEQIKAIRARAEMLREIASLYPVIVKVYREFDGKVYNCRLEKALKEATENRVYCYTKPKYISVYSYSRGTEYTLTYVEKEKLIDGKRINAELFIESARERRAALLRDAAALDRAAENMDAIRAQLGELKRAYNTIVNSVPYEARDICGFRNIY